MSAVWSKMNVIKITQREIPKIKVEVVFSHFSNENTRFLTMDVYEASVTVTLTKKPSRLWRLT